MIACWNGASWSALGSGTGLGTSVNAIAVMGSTVYVGGEFRQIGGVAATNLACWDGTAWTAVGGGLQAGAYLTVRALLPAGTDLYVAGSFLSPGTGVALNNLARWDGANWFPLGTGTYGTINAVAMSRDVLFATGYFTSMGVRRHWGWPAGMARGGPAWAAASPHWARPQATRSPFWATACMSPGGRLPGLQLRPLDRPGAGSPSVVRRILQLDPAGDLAGGRLGFQFAARDRARVLEHSDDGYERGHHQRGLPDRHPAGDQPERVLPFAATLRKAASGPGVPGGAYAHKAGPAGGAGHSSGDKRPVVFAAWYMTIEYTIRA